MRIENLDNVCGPAEDATFDIPEVGQVRMHDVGVDWMDSLKSFYARNYRDTYPLLNTDLFKWMFKHVDGKVSVLTKDSDVLAHQAHVPLIVTDGLNDFAGFLSASTMVDKDHRRMGLMSKLRGTVHGRYEIAASLGGSAQGKSLYAKMGYDALGDLIRTVAVVDSSRCGTVTQNGETLEKTIANYGSKTQNSKCVVEVKRFAEFAPLIEELWEKTFQPGSYLAVRRTPEYLDWRYTDHPVFRYRRFVLQEAGEVKAVLVFRHEDVKDLGIRLIRIVDLFGDEASLAELVGNAVLRPEELAGTAWIDWFCSTPRFTEPLKTIGFLPAGEYAPTIFPIFCNPIDYYKKSYTLMFWPGNDVDIKIPSSFDQCYFTKGDGDADRPNNCND